MMDRSWHWIVLWLGLAVCLAVVIIALAAPSIHNSHVERLHRIDACQEAKDVTLCLRLNR